MVDLIIIVSAPLKKMARPSSKEINMKDICVKCGTKFEWVLDDAIIRYGCGNPKAIVPCPYCKKLNIVFER